MLHPGAGVARPAAEDIEGLAEIARRTRGPLAGDAAAGERVFFHDQISRLLALPSDHGRGARIGPELTNHGRAL